MKKRTRRILLGILGAASILATVLIAVLWAAGPSGVPDDAVYVPRDVPSLQDALDRASPGDMIVIESGPIEGPILITVPDITLISSGARVSLNGVGSEPALSIQAPGVIIRGLIISAESIGVQVDASDCTMEDLRVESATIGIQLNQASRCILHAIETRGAATGIELIGSRSVTINNLTVIGSADYGVRLLGARNNTLKNLTVTDSAVGISIESASVSNVIESSRIEASSIAGIQIRSSNDNTLLDTSLSTCRVGLALEAVTGTEIRGCSVLAPTISGVVLQQAVQNRILETRIAGSQGSGIRLSQSAENALFYNSISDCRESGIALVTSERNLVMGNEVDGCSIGIHVSRSNGTRILRNTVSNATLSGLYVSQGKSNRLLDNVTTGGTFGLVISESGSNTILRNRLSGGEGAGMLLIGSTGDNHVSENEMVDNLSGLVLAAATRDRIIQNQVLNNETGISFIGLGSGVRIEGNSILKNGTGLRLPLNLDELKAALDVLGIVIPQANDAMMPILANNVFKDNESLDIQNDTMVTVPAADNWWGAVSSRDVSAAVVSDGVALEQSAWKGVVAVGTGSDSVRILLGRILQLALTEAGFRVIDLVGMGPPELVQQALSDSDVDLIWWGGATSDSHSPTASSSSNVVSTLAVQGWSVIVSSQLAGQLASTSVSGLADWVNQSGTLLRVAATSGLSKDSSDTFLATYGLKGAVRSFTRAEALKEVEALLKFGAVDVAIVDSLEETLTRSGFLSITDDLRLLDEVPISMIVQQTISTGYAEISEMLAAL